jgi:aspartokinase
MSSTLITSIVLKSNVTLVDVISTRMMGQYGFLATVFDAFKRYRISVDVVATSEVWENGMGRGDKNGVLRDQIVSLKVRTYKKGGE